MARKIKRYFILMFLSFFTLWNKKAEAEGVIDCVKCRPNTTTAEAFCQTIAIQKGQAENKTYEASVNGDGSICYLREADAPISPY